MLQGCILLVISTEPNFLDKFSKSTKILKFMKICPAGAELFHADGQTGHTDRRS